MKDKDKLNYLKREFERLKLETDELSKVRDIQRVEFQETINHLCKVLSRRN